MHSDFRDISDINPVQHLSPRWGLEGIGVPMYYTPIAPLGLYKLGNLKILIYQKTRNRRNSRELEFPPT